MTSSLMYTTKYARPKYLKFQILGRTCRCINSVINIGRIENYKSCRVETRDIIKDEKRIATVKTP